VPCLAAGGGGRGGAPGGGGARRGGGGVSSAVQRQRRRGMGVGGAEEAREKRVCLLWGVGGGGAGRGGAGRVGGGAQCASHVPPRGSSSTLAPSQSEPLAAAPQHASSWARHLSGQHASRGRQRRVWVLRWRL
jgi:hypothetical protein